MAELMQGITEKTTFRHAGRTYQVPDYMIKGILDYVLRHIEPGGFLRKIFENDFVGAASLADRYNMPNLPAYANFIYNYTPRACWGSPAAVNAWVENKEG